MLGHHLRRWPSIKTTLGERIMFARIWQVYFKKQTSLILVILGQYTYYLYTVSSKFRNKKRH